MRRAARTNRSTTALRIFKFTCEDYKSLVAAIHTTPRSFAEDRVPTRGAPRWRLCATATDEYTIQGVKLSGNTIQTVCGGHNGIERAGGATKFVAQRQMSCNALRHHLDECAKILGLYPRRRHHSGAYGSRTHRSHATQNPDAGRSPCRCRLQHLGGFSLSGVSGDDHPTR